MLHKGRKTSDNEYADVSIDTSAPHEPVSSGSTQRITSGEGRTLAGTKTGKVTSVHGSHARGTQWTFTRAADGAYTIRNTHSGRVLGVDSDSKAGRAWGARPTATRANGSVGQQWWVVANKPVDDGSAKGTYRLVNRYSGLVLALPDGKRRTVDTTPLRAWTGASRTEAEQTVSLEPAS